MQLENNQDSVRQEELEQHTTTAAAITTATTTTCMMLRLKPTLPQVRPYNHDEETNALTNHIKECNTKQRIKHSFHRTSSGKSLLRRLCNDDYNKNSSITFLKIWRKSPGYRDTVLQILKHPEIRNEYLKPYTNMVTPPI